MNILSWLDKAPAEIADAEGKMLRSVALICASVHVAGMNVSSVTKLVVYGSDYVLNEAKKFERYLEGK